MQQSVPCCVHRTRKNVFGQVAYSYAEDERFVKVSNMIVLSLEYISHDVVLERLNIQSIQRYVTKISQIHPTATTISSASTTAQVTKSIKCAGASSFTISICNGDVFTHSEFLTQKMALNVNRGKK